MQDKEYFRPLHKQIEHGGAESMFYDLQLMELGDWHPRDIPEALLRGSALRKQQEHTLPAMEQWYVMLLHDGRLPGALSNKPNTAFTSRLRDDAKERVPRLKFDLSDVMLKDFLTDPERIGIVCEKYRANTANGWTFPPLDEARSR
jgi:hypothetical protein